MSRKIELLLSEWGTFRLKHMFHALEYGENTLYRAGLMGGRVQNKSDGHKILCEDTPRHLQRVDILLHRIPIMETLAIKCWYCCPSNDGQPFTKAQLALKLRMSLSAFEDNLKQGRKSLKKLGL